jgi:hypothetical protein
MLLLNMTFNIVLLGVSIWYHDRVWASISSAVIFSTIVFGGNFVFVLLRLGEPEEES